MCTQANLVVTNRSGMPPRTRAAARHGFRVRTHNVLSPALGTPKAYPTYPVSHIDPAKRLPRILEELKAELGGPDGDITVFCFQELAAEWVPSFAELFSSHGFFLFYTHYTWAHSSNMGVAIAWNTSVFTCTGCEMKQVGNLLPKMAKPTPVRSFLAPLLDYVWPPRPPAEHWWDTCRRRYNELLLVGLVTHEGREFYVATLHAPCMYTNPTAMDVNVGIATKYVQGVVKKAPVVFAGDFNIKPGDKAYWNMTNFTKVYDDAEPLPQLECESGWQYDAPSPMFSAYKTPDGHEPPTTRARMLYNDIFFGTLDYIFYRGDIEVVETMPLPDISDRILPDAECGSDHLPIAATFKFM